MKRVFIIAFLLSIIFVNNSFAQAPDWIWVQGTCATGYQYGNNIYSSPSGYIYTGGRLTSGNSNLGNVTVNSPGTCVFNGKLTSSSQFVWGSAYFHTSFDYLYSFNRDDDGNLYSTGESQGGGPPMWAQRCDSNGVLNWSVTNGTGKGFAIGADRWGNIYLGGQYSGSITFGTTTISSLGSEDIFLVKFNSAGVVQWVKNVGGTGDDRIVKAIRTDRSGNIYFTGSYTGSPVYGGISLAPSTGYENYYLAKFDSSGNGVWVATANSAGPDASYDNGDDLQLDSTGNVYVTSTFQGTSVFGSTTLTSAGGDDIFVAKLDNNGNWLWAKSAGGTSAREEGCGIALGRNFDVFVIGIYQNTASFGAITLTGQGFNRDNAFVAKYDNATGNEIWVQTAGDASGDNNGYGITVDKYNYVYVTGDFATKSIFGTNAITAPGGDLYIAKLDTVAGFKTQSMPDSTYCPGSSGQLSFNVNRPFFPGNTFTAQLSDGTGSFASPVSIGTLSGINGGAINITIPAGTPTGNGYKIRVISSNPVDTDFSYGCVHDILTPVFADSATKISGNGGTLTVSQDTSVCSGSTVQLNVSGGTTYLWSPATNLSCTSCANPIATVLSSLTYTVTSSTSGGCNSSGTVQLNLGGSAAGGYITAIRDTICQGTPGNLTLNNSSGNNLQWQLSADKAIFTDITTAVDTTKYKTPPLFQTMWYRVTVGSGNCTATSDTFQLYVPPALTAYFNASQTGTSQLSFNADSSSGNIHNYHWDFGDGNTSSEQNPSHTYAKDTTYYVCLTLYDGSNCSYTFCRYSDVTDAIPHISPVNDWKIYPNPFNNYILINGKELNKAIEKIQVIDVLGRIVLNMNIDKNQLYPAAIDMSILANGIYYLRIETQQTDYVQKMIKQ